MGLGRSFFGRALSVPVGVLVAALLAPPLLHNHGPHPASVVSHLTHACTAGSDTPHLHPAQTSPAPQCPACAAGPAAPGIQVHAALELGARRAAPVPAPAPRRCSSWVAFRRGARAPPAISLDV